MTTATKESRAEVPANGPTEPSSQSPGPTAVIPLKWVPEAMDRLIELTVATCASPETRRMYRSQLITFIKSGHKLNREGLALYLQKRRDAGASSSTIIAATTAIRKLAHEAAIRKLMSRDELDELMAVKAGKHYATRAGLWLTMAQAETFLALPDRSRYLGKRDACLLATMLGCGLRRSEMAGLKWDRLQQREGRAVWSDINGKGGKRRTIPIPNWALPDIQLWKHTIETEPLYQNENPAIRMDPSYVSGGISHDTIHDIVNQYGDKMGLELNPHDLRRTLSQMMRRAGADLEQIQYTLGHENIETTVRYLGTVIELAPGMAAVDRVKLQMTNSGGTIAPISADSVNQIQMGMMLEHMADQLRERETPEGCD